jgi:hypothetical protein
MAKSSVHVVPSGENRWSVIRGGAERATKTFSTKEEAIEAGKSLSRSTSADLFVHKKDGTIQEANSYGQDPHPPADTRGKDYHPANG